MSKNIEEQLKKISLENPSASERDTMWRVILDKRNNPRQSLLPVFILNTPMTAILIALVILLGGSGAVVAVADNSKPGDALFGLDLAVERARLAMTSEEKKDDLAMRFGQERLEEVQKLRGDGSVDDDSNNSAISTSATQIEADVFTNETVVKIETNDRKFGFITEADTREEIVTAIVNKYDISRAIVESKLDLEVEDRASRADDKDFLNNTPVNITSSSNTNITLDEREKRDVETSFNQVIRELEKNNTALSTELKTALAALLISAQAEGKIEFESNGQEIEIKSKDGVIKVEIDDESDKDKDDDKNDDNDDDKKDQHDNSGSGSNNSDDDNDNEDDDDDSSNSSGSGSSDDDGSDDSDDDNEDDDDNSGHGGDDDNDSDDDDNSGHGGN